MHPSTHKQHIIHASLVMLIMVALPAQAAWQNRAASWILKSARNYNLACIPAAISLSLGKTAYNCHTAKGALHARSADVTPELQNYCKQIIGECGVDTTNLQIRSVNWYNSIGITANRTLIIDRDTAHDIQVQLLAQRGDSKEKPSRSLQSFAVTLRHEAAHIHYGDNPCNNPIKYVFSIGCAAALAQILAYPVEKKLLSPARSISTAFLKGISLTVLGLSKILLLDVATLMLARTHEKRADKFAIYHTKNAQELQAMAENYFTHNHKKILDHLDTSGMLNGWYLSSGSQLPKQEWLHKHSKLIFALADPTHPHPLDRAKACTDAAEKLEKQNQASDRGR